MSQNKSHLYYTLNKELKTVDLKKSEKQYVLDSIQVMDQTSLKMICELIAEHYKNENDGIPITEIPYEGCQKPEGVEFNMAKFPIQLRHIIFKFIKIVQNQN